MHTSSLKGNLDYHVVAVSSSVVGLAGGIPEGLVSLGVGLLGVALARWVFVNREYRTTKKPQGWSDTLPLTLVAMLITGVLIWDRKFGVSTSAFVGLGVGWTAVILLDVLGDWILLRARAMFSAGPPLNPSVPFHKTSDLSGNDGMMISGDVTSDPAMAKLLNDAGQALDASEARRTGREKGSSVETPHNGDSNFNKGVPWNAEEQTHRDEGDVL